MEKEEQVKMVQCPEPDCTVKLSEDDLQGQIRHMEEKHPNSKVVEERRKRR